MEEISSSWFWCQVPPLSDLFQTHSPHGTSRHDMDTGHRTHIPCSAWKNCHKEICQSFPKDRIGKSLAPGWKEGSGVVLFSFPWAPILFIKKEGPASKRNHPPPPPSSYMKKEEDELTFSILLLLFSFPPFLLPTKKIFYGVVVPFALHYYYLSFF